MAEEETPGRKDLIGNGGDGDSNNRLIKVAPRYLSPSVSSCHDICKYGGRRHAFQEKPWKSFPRKPPPRRGGESVHVVKPSEDEEAIAASSSITESKTTSDSKQKKGSIPFPKKLLPKTDPPKTFKTSLLPSDGSKGETTSKAASPSLVKSSSLRIRSLRLASTVKDHQIRVLRFKNGTSDFRIEKKTKKTKKSESETETKQPQEPSPCPKQNPNKAPPRKAAASKNPTNYSPPVKLKFKTGKVVDPQSDINTPRRLRFRKAKVLVAAEGSTNTKQPDLMRRRTFSNDASVSAGAAEMSSSSEKIVLKHQDLQDKKDSQGLFNNVIEETASKLVATRKSKVKALVGAFETVISLQESKPSQPLLSS